VLLCKEQTLIIFNFYIMPPQEHPFETPKVGRVEEEACILKEAGAGPELLAVLALLTRKAGENAPA